jgi:hypothetical protein
MIKSFTYGDFQMSFGDAWQSRRSRMGRFRVAADSPLSQETYLALLGTG